MKRLIITLGLFLACPVWAETRPNILLIVIDDLNDYVGCLGGHPDASTPHIDALAERGILFTNAHCNSPVCNPSRASIWTGLRPHTTGITTNHSGFFRDHPDYSDIITLPKALNRQGYATAGFGKLFHLGHGNRPHPDFEQERRYSYGPNLKVHLNYREGDRLSDWGIPPADLAVRRGISPSHPSMASFDHDIASRTIEYLRDTHDRPFFLACGFFRPHTPLYAEREWFDRFPPDQVSLPETLPGDLDDLPYFGRLERREVDIEAPGLWNHEWVTSNGKWKEIVRAYLASTAAMDAQVGRIVEALVEHLERSRDTYVILCSDHGWHLGEKEHWGKAALWEQTTRVPLIVSGPGIPRGVKCDRSVELLSLYPTIMDLVGGKAPHSLEGHSLEPLLRNPAGDWTHPAVTTFSDHHAVRKDRYRYIRYVDGSEELYDLEVDPHEWNNLAVSGDHPSLPGLREQLDRIVGVRFSR